jgi:hypothetical protein
VVPALIQQAGATLCCDGRLTRCLAFQNSPDWMDRYNVGAAVTLFAVWGAFFYLVRHDSR